MTDYPLVQHLREFDPLLAGAEVTLSEGDTRAAISLPTFVGLPKPSYNYELTAPADLPDESVWPTMGLRVDLTVVGTAGRVYWEMQADDPDTPDYTSWWNSVPPDFGIPVGPSPVSVSYDLTSGGFRAFGPVVPVPEFIDRLLTVTPFRHLLGKVELDYDGPATVTSFRVVLYTLDSAAWYEPPLRQYPRQDDRASMGVRRMWPRTESRRIGHIP